MVTRKPKNMDEYIAVFPIDTQNSLFQLRSTIKKKHLKQ